VYKQGADNRVADALSRRAHQSDECSAISSPVPQWCHEIVLGYGSDPQAQELLTKLSLNPDSAPNFSIQDGILKFQNRIWLGSNLALQHKILHALHGSAIGGHSGFPVTYRRVKQLFAWPGMKKAVQLFVLACTTC